MTLSQSLIGSFDADFHKNSKSGLLVTTSTTTQPQNGDEDEDSNVLLGHVAHQDDDAV